MSVVGDERKSAKSRQEDTDRRGPQKINLVSKMNAWLTFEDLKWSLEEAYSSALKEGHGEDAAISKAAAVLAIDRDQLGQRAIACRITKLVLSSGPEEM